MSYIAIESQTVSGSVATVTFNSIPSTVGGVAIRDLVLVIQARATSESAYSIRFNGDTNSNYNVANLLGTTSTASANSSLSSSAATIAPSSVAATTTLGNTHTKVEIFDFNQTNKHKAFLVRSNRPDNSTLAQAGRWANTSAITSLTILLNNSQLIDSGSTFNLWGVAA